MAVKANGNLIRIAALASMLVAGLATSGAAQSPFIIDGVVPANGTPAGPTQPADPYSAVKELGPVNSNETKVGVIHLAPLPMPPSRSGSMPMRRARGSSGRRDRSR